MSSQQPTQSAFPDSSAQPGARLGVDLGSNHIRIGVLTADGQLRHFHRENYAVACDIPANGPALAQQLRQLLQQTLAANPGVTALGIAFPGLIQQPAQRILKLDHAPGLVGLELHSELRNALNLPVQFENSASAAAYAEMNAGVARGVRDWLYLHIGANVSAGLVLGGQLQRGKSGLAGAIGEMAIDPEHTGEFVSLESMVSAENIARRTRRRLERDSTSSLSRLRIMGGFTYDDIVSAANNGDDLARLMLQRTGKFIGMAIAEVINLLDLSLVAIGGAATARRFLVPAIAQEVEQRASELLYANCQIVAAELGAEASVIGAALLAG
jgi:predicted NBD/HSP70 family sugar kinase